MDYAQRLFAAAEIVIQSDGDAAAAAPLLDEKDLGVSATLKPHQLEGVAWLLRRYHLGVNVILGDEMGLGKTLQAISLLSYLKTQLLLHGPFLILCPLSVTDSWLSEFTRYCATLRVIQYVGEKEHRRGLRKMMYEHISRQSSTFPTFDGNLDFPFDVLLTTYDIALLEQDFLCQIPWYYAVIDEAQRLKNPSSVLYRVLEQRYIMPRRLLMTGTPIQNNLSELWALLHFCLPLVFGTLEQFISAFKEAGRSLTDRVKEVELLRYILKAFMLRRTKGLLIESGRLTLPPLSEITVMAPLVPLQKKVYTSILRKELPTLLSLISGASNHQSLQNIVVQLRKACSHPYLFSCIEPEPYEEGEHLIQACGKLIVLDQLLARLHATGHRVLLFAQMTRTLDILQDFLDLRKYAYERLDGSVRAEERFAAIRSFGLPPAKEISEVCENQIGGFVFLISTRAGGVGLNLVAADTVIFYEQDWNPQVDKQALQRSHRIGQMNHVLSINLVSERSIEEVIMQRAERKLELYSNIIGHQDNNYSEGKDGLETNDIRSLIFGLHMFDPSSTESLSANEIVELNAITTKVLELRNHDPACKDDGKLKINDTHMPAKFQLLHSATHDAVNFNPALDEASYTSWVEKLKEASHLHETSIFDVGKRRVTSEERSVKLEADKRKADEKRLARWEADGYQSLAVKDPDDIMDNIGMTDSGSVNFVYGDCTDPSKHCPSEPAIIFSCVDTSGNWGRGGMFTALAKLSSCIPDAYCRASEFDDIHMGDLHLIELKGSGGDSNIIQDAPLWVALAVVQSYNARRKVPRSGISITELERCLSKVCFSAAQHSASIHMPRINFQDGSQHSEWYAVERLLRKYASIRAVKIFVYYFRRSPQQ